jgi:hypothetical protein
LNIAAGLGADAVMIQLATRSWFEGGIEGYDRGQGDAHGRGGAADERWRDSISYRLLGGLAPFYSARGRR